MLVDKFKSIPKEYIYIFFGIISYLILFVFFNNNKEYINSDNKINPKIDSLYNVIDSLNKDIYSLNNKISLLEYQDSLINNDIDTLNYNDKIIENKINNNIKEKNEKNLFYLNTNIDSVYRFMSEH
jgi:predicted  nucleic acid-binding Zn-ribbon protein